MAADHPPSSQAGVCPSCGLRQDPGHRECTRCGQALNAPGLIYRHEADNTWSVVRDIDLSSFAAPPAPPPKKRLSRRAAMLILLLVVTGATINLGLWRWRVAAGRGESNEISYYLAHPVGTIEPRFALQYRRTEQGQLRMAGQTNLPDGTNLQVEVYAGDLIVAIDFPVAVFAGRFQTRALLQRGKPFVLAAYQARLSTTFDRNSQPPPVLLVVGDRGERLRGPLIYRVDAASGANLRYVENFSLSQ